MSDLTSMIELNDSDILRIESVVKILNDRQGKVLNMDAFRRESEERFADAGFRVTVKCYTTNQEGLYAFDIEINDRLEGQFDPDQMVHEATNDVLELGTGGVIKSAPLLAQQAQPKSKLWTPGSHNH
jgi:hypothetical protein